MFPAGSAGIGLIVLRSVVAATVVIDARGWPMSFGLVVGGISAIAGLCLIIGFLTPYCAVLSCAIELALVVAADDPNRGQTLMSALTAAAAATLGPGAYSVDARLFGRQLIKIPARRS
jgi:uncharacterized membrane protein YphA (DoxX/SURF4 family)